MKGNGQKKKKKEKEELWLEKLDKKVRWVDGVRVDISEGEEEYYKLLEVKRAKNKRLGYGDDTENWERKKYENERRNLKKMERYERKYGKTIRHWLVTELGQEKTERVHMHGILWLDEKPKGYDGWKKKEQITYKIYDEEHEFGKNKVSWYEYNKEQVKDLNEKWGYGIVRLGRS